MCKEGGWREEEGGTNGGFTRVDVSDDDDVDVSLSCLAVDISLCWQIGTRSPNQRRRLDEMRGGAGDKN